MSIALNATSAVLSLTSFTFYLIGVIGYSLQNSVIENVNWFVVDNVNGLTVYVGLRKLITESGGTTQEIIYSGTSCSGSACSVCEREGDNAFALLVVSVVFSFIAVVLSIAGAAVPAKEISGANLAASFVALVFGVIGWSLFVQQCFNEEIKDQVRIYPVSPLASIHECTSVLKMTAHNDTYVMLGPLLRYFTVQRGFRLRPRRSALLDRLPALCHRRGAADRRHLTLPRHHRRRRSSRPTEGRTCRDQRTLRIKESTGVHFNFLKAVPCGVYSNKLICMKRCCA